MLCFNTFIIVLNCYFPSRGKVYDSLEVVNLSILLQFTISTEEFLAKINRNDIDSEAVVFDAIASTTNDKIKFFVEENEEHASKAPGPKAPVEPPAQAQKETQEQAQKETQAQAHVQDLCHE